MRWLVVVGVLLAVVGTAQAQVAWVGASAGTSWEYKADSATDRTWKHRNDPVPQVFVAMPLEDATLVRLRVAEIPYELRLPTGHATCTLRSYTLGVDYMIDSVLGEAVFSAGVGGYRLVVDKGVAPSEFQTTKFGYYVGAGEWYALTKRLRLTAEVTLHRTENAGTPSIVTATAGLAFSF